MSAVVSLPSMVITGVPATGFCTIHTSPLFPFSAVVPLPTFTYALPSESLIVAVRETFPPETLAKSAATTRMFDALTAPGVIAAQLSRAVAQVTWLEVAVCTGDAVIYTSAQSRTRREYEDSAKTTARKSAERHD